MRQIGITRVSIAMVLSAALAACGGASNAPPTAQSQAATLAEDSVVQGAASGQDADGDPITFLVETPPAHGQVTLDAASGEWTYTPTANFNGTDGFRFVTFDAKVRSIPATVSLTVTAVNDAPVMGIVADQRNSAYTLETTVALPLSDVDGDVLRVSSSVANPAVATAVVSPDGLSVAITPLQPGTTTITVTALDAQDVAASSTFGFSIGEVTQNNLVATRADGSQTIDIINNSSRPATFTLKYNGNEAFTSASAAAAHVAAMVPEYAGEPFARKLWRYVRDNTYHNVPINAEQWWYDMWATMNSLGFGFCGHVAATYVEIARAAGYDARIWGLNGHVVPEIYVDGRWQMYDPDIAVYYLNRSGQVAGVEELAGDRDLVRNPPAPIFKYPDFWGYTDLVADIYASPGDNRVADDIFLANTPTGRTEIALPPSAKLRLPGRWTPAPVGVDGETPYPIEQFRQAALELPAGWTGTIPLPWVLWDVQGEGQVALNNQSFAASSSELAGFLKAPSQALTSIEVSSNVGGLRLVFMINATWYDVLAQNQVELTGLDVWTLRVQPADVAPEQSVSAFPTWLRKPTP